MTVLASKLSQTLVYYFSLGFYNILTHKNFQSLWNLIISNSLSLSISVDQKVLKNLNEENIQIYKFFFNILVVIGNVYQGWQASTLIDLKNTVLQRAFYSNFFLFFFLFSIFLVFGFMVCTHIFLDSKATRVFFPKKVLFNKKKKEKFFSPNIIKPISYSLFLF